MQQATRLDAPHSTEQALPRQVLVAERLSKSYDGRNALWDLSFTLAPGRILGLLGNNGAGKTTAIRILTTIIEPTSGHFSVDGIGSDRPDRIRQRIGVLPETLGFPKRQTALEHLVYFGRHYGRTTKDARTTAVALLREVGLEQRARSLIGTYSRGMRQRLGIARALVGDPVVVFLDEPTLGLDPKGQQDLLALIGDVARERDAAVVLCSHLLGDVEAVCDEVLILRDGRAVAWGSVGAVTAAAEGSLPVVRVRVPRAEVDAARTALARAPEVVAVEAMGGEGEWLVVDLAEPGAPPPPDLRQRKHRLYEALTLAGVDVISFESGNSRLADAFMELTSDEPEPQAASDGRGGR